MGANRLFYFVLMFVGMLGSALWAKENERVELTELLKDRDVREIYAAASQTGGKVVARLGVIRLPDGKQEVVLWLFVRDNGVGLRLVFFKSIDNHRILVISFDGHTTDNALRELLK